MYIVPHIACIFINLVKKVNPKNTCANVVDSKLGERPIRHRGQQSCVLLKHIYSPETRGGCVPYTILKKNKIILYNHIKLRKIEL